MSKNDFPTEPYPLHITNPNNAFMRGRYVDIENVNQPESRSRNAVHIELFDTVEIGRLIRKDHQKITTGDQEAEFGVDNGYLLCDRNVSNSVIFHSKDNSTVCKKCLRIALRLEKSGIKIFVVKKEAWYIIQEAYSEHEAHKFISKAGFDTKEGKKRVIEMWNKINNNELF